jgi:hypothetical protein
MGPESNSVVDNKNKTIEGETYKVRFTFLELLFERR